MRQTLQCVRWVVLATVLGGVWLSLSGCKHSPSGLRSHSALRLEAGARPGFTGAKDSPGAVASTAGSDVTALMAAERSVANGEIAKSLLLYSQAADIAAEKGKVKVRRQALEGMARSHEKLGNFPGAIRVYQFIVDSSDEALPTDHQLARIFASKGACEAEVEDWLMSARSYGRARSTDSGEEPSFAVELRAREGFAWFQIERWNKASEAFAAAENVFQKATEENVERFDSLYFVAMARFYQGAIEHRKFQSLRIRAAKTQMTEDFDKKLAILQVAQEHYRQTIRTNHVFWVSAAGYQMGVLLIQFYDALMYAPIPDWLNAKDRLVYYEELKKQLRPIVDKAIWVYEKNIETARRLGYKTAFIERTERQLNSLQAVLREGDSSLGKPLSRLSPSHEEERSPIAVAMENPLEGHNKKVFLPTLRPL